MFELWPCPRSTKSGRSLVRQPLLPKKREKGSDQMPIGAVSPRTVWCAPME